MDSRGQDQWGVGGLVALLVLIAVGALVTYEVTGAVDKTVGRTSFTDNTGNANLSDYLDDTTFRWDNTVENYDVTWATDNAGDNLVVINMDNNDGLDNFIFYQAVVLDIHDGITSATVAFKYCIVDNSNADTIAIRVQLCDGIDNTLVFYDNILENATTYTSVENSVTDNIANAGTYTVYFRLESQSTGFPLEEPVGIEVHFDDVKLTIDTYGAGYAENAISNVESKGSTVFSLLAILAIVVVAALIIGVVITAIGGRGSATR